MNKVGLIISFYDEDDVVRKTITALKSYDATSPIVCIHSDSGKCSKDNLRFIKANSKFIKLPNLAIKYHQYELPAVVVSRNYSEGFKEFYRLKKPTEYTVAILGDTHIYDFKKLIDKMDIILKDKKAGVLQALGQNFHSKDADPINGVCGGRKQVEGTTDIMPQLFILHGVKGFTNIENTNKWTSEENLGNELSKHIDFPLEAVRLNTGVGAYSFNCGLRLQVKGLGHTRC